MQGMVEALYNLVQSLMYSAIVFFMVGFDISVGKQGRAGMMHLQTFPKLSHTDMAGQGLHMLIFGRRLKQSAVACSEFLLVCILHVYRAAVLHHVRLCRRGPHAKPYGGCCAIFRVLWCLEPHCGLHHTRAGRPCILLQ